MLFIFSTPVVIRHLWQLKTAVFLHRCLISAVLLLQRVPRKSTIPVSIVKLFLIDTPILKLQPDIITPPL